MWPAGNLASCRSAAGWPVRSRRGSRAMKFALESWGLPAALIAERQPAWSRTKNLMLAMLGLWISYFLVVHFFIVPLNRIIVPILGVPLGVYLALQGALIVFVVMLFSFGKAQGWKEPPAAGTK